MSIIYECEQGCLLSHHEFIKDVYKNVATASGNVSFQYNVDIFDINRPYKKQSNSGRKRKLAEETKELLELAEEAEYVKEQYGILKSKLVARGFLSEAFSESNDKAQQLSEQIYDISKKSAISNAVGGSQSAVLTKIDGETFLFPKNSKFFCKNTSEISKYIQNSHDLILLDPPWWNKYIRRKNAKSLNAYEMMYNEDLKDLPLENIVSANGIVVVWCTNAARHITALRNEIFPKWGLNYIGTWFWLKITTSGSEICNYSEPPGKQPFERIIFGAKHTKIDGFQDRKVVVSVPSALHSHKPPLLDVLKPFVSQNSQCLEVFARYLMPNWTSYGLEAILLQHDSLFEKKL